MKFNYKAARSPCKMERSPTPVAVAPVEFIAPHPTTSPLKEHVLEVKPPFSPVGVSAALFSLNNNTRPVHNKENNRKEHSRSPELVPGVLEDSGYLSLQNSHIDDDDHKEADPKTVFTHSLGSCTPTKCDRKTLVSEHMVSSTPTAQHSDPNLTILRFQQAVCEALSKSFQRTQRYDWSVVDKIAEDYMLDRVIGRQMGLDHVDVFASLLFRNMRGILTFILAQLGDMDLISGKKVSKAWERVIREDEAASCRCEQAERRLQDLRLTPGQSASGLTRDVGVSRVVLSCMQTLASSTPCSRTSRRVSQSQKDGTPTRFQEFIDVASSLKQYESLCRCKRCGSPAKTQAEARWATCTRSSCLFHFCTRCQEAFHGSSPCRSQQPRAHPSSRSNIIAGSARSKRNVRRL